MADKSVDPLQIEKSLQLRGAGRRADDIRAGTLDPLALDALGIVRVFVNPAALSYVGSRVALAKHRQQRVAVDARVIRSTGEVAQYQWCDTRPNYVKPRLPCVERF